MLRYRIGVYMNVNYSLTYFLEKKAGIHIFVTSSRVEEFAKPILQRMAAKAVDISG